MKTLTSQLRELGCSKTQIHRYLQKLNRSGYCAYDVTRVVVSGNEIEFYMNYYGGMVIVYQFNK